MLNPIITPPRVPLVDPDTGLISRAWYLFFLSLNNVANAVVDDPAVGPSPESLIASYDAALQALAQDVGTQPAPVDLSAEIIKQIEAAGLVDQSSALLSQVAELQKQIDALNSLPPILPTPITNGASILYGDNLGGFSNVTIGSGVSFSGGTLSATGSGGTVTSVSVATANGLAGTSSGGATPALTLSTTVTGVLKGNGTAISAAVVNTDYFAPSAPVTKTADFTVAATDVWLINNKSGSTCTATLPTAASWTGRVLYFQNYQVQALVSASSNVVPVAGGAAGTSILLASSGDSATLVSDGSNWLMTQYVPNNILLLE
jgi:hypothetical protein